MQKDLRRDCVCLAGAGMLTTLCNCWYHHSWTIDPLEYHDLVMCCKPEKYHASETARSEFHVTLLGRSLKTDTHTHEQIESHES